MAGEDQSVSDMDDFIRLLTKCKSEVKVTKRIPRGARVCVAQKLTSVINRCVEENSTKAWQDLFLFPYRILNTTDKKKDKSSFTSKIKGNVSNNNANPITSNSFNRGNYNASKIIESKVFDTSHHQKCCYFRIYSNKIQYFY